VLFILLSLGLVEVVVVLDQGFYISEIYLLISLMLAMG